MIPTHRIYEFFQIEQQQQQQHVQVIRQSLSG